MRKLLTCALAAVLMAALPATSFAGPFVSVPKAKKMKIRFIKYTGGSSGRMIVEVRNDAKRTQKFSAKGLYFVPSGDPDKAPQRLGAAGPFEANEGQQWKRKESVTLKPGATMQLKLQVFCLDSHRSSPGASQKFSVARKRLPRKLSGKISRGAKGILRHKAPRAATSEIQSHVWKTRNKKWIKLQGERKHEKSAEPQRNRAPLPQEQRRHKRPMRNLR